MHVSLPDGKSRQSGDLTLALDSRLADGVAALSLPMDDGTRGRLIEFLALLVRWNGVYNLTSIRGIEDMLVVHLLDALSVVRVLDGFHPKTIVDVGSGAGLPAIPLAIVRPQWSLRSIDAVAKKVAFQRQAKAALELLNLTPVQARVEALSLPAPDVIVSRAYADLPTMVASVAHLVAERTVVVAMKGAIPAAEIAALPRGWDVDEVVSIDVPFLGAERCAVVIRRAVVHG